MRATGEASAKEIAHWRADTPGCRNVIHLNNAGSSLPPQVVLRAMEDHLRLEAEMGGYEAAAFARQRIAQFYPALGRLVGAEAHQIAYAGSATHAYNMALSAIPFQSGDVIVTTDDDYSSNHIAFISLTQRFGIQVVRVGQREGQLDLEAMETALKKHRPRLVAVTHIPTNSGLIQPVAEVGKLCRTHDCWYLVDACQSAGQLPLNVNEIQCDFLSATFRKFLRGPRGAGFLYASDRVLHEGLAPLLPDLHGATWLSPDEFRIKPDATRFEYWEIPYALQLGSLAAVEYALAVGLETIRDRVQSLAAYCRAQLSHIPGIRVLDEGAALGGIVTLWRENGRAQRLQAHLSQAGINTSVSMRENALIDFDRKGVDWALRISPHYYNTSGEIDILVEKLIALSEK